MVRQGGFFAAGVAVGLNGLDGLDSTGANDAQKSN